MTLELLALSVAAMSTFSGGNFKPVDNNHFLIYGDVIEIDPVELQESDASDTQVIIFQDGEIYVAFNTGNKGEYKFNLPVNHNYEIVYGGDKYVNKRINVDAHNLPKMKYGHNVKLDLGMVKSYEGVDYEFLNDPVALISYDLGFGKLTFDEKYSKKQGKSMFKCFKQIMKMHG